MPNENRPGADQYDRGRFAGQCRQNPRRVSARSPGGAALVVTPEMAITGYPPRDLLAKHRFVADNLRALDELAGQIGPVPLVVGYVEVNSRRPGKDYFNAAAVARDGKIVERGLKRSCRLTMFSTKTGTFSPPSQITRSNSTDGVLVSRSVKIFGPRIICRRACMNAALSRN